MRKGQQSSPESRSLNKTEKWGQQKIKSKQQHVLRKNGQSSKLHNGRERKEGRNGSSQFYANQEPSIKYLQQFCTMPDTMWKGLSRKTPLNSIFWRQTCSMPFGLLQNNINHASGYAWTHSADFNLGNQNCCGTQRKTKKMPWQKYLASERLPVLNSSSLRHPLDDLKPELRMYAVLPSGQIVASQLIKLGWDLKIVKRVMSLILSLCSPPDDLHNRER